MVSFICTILFLTFVGSSVQDRSIEGPLLSTFREVHHEFEQGNDGVYRFSFALPQQERHEERDSEGKVTGAFAFVDNVGEEVSLKYDADEEGFQPKSDALPQVPDETDDVQKARDEFLEYYRQTVQFLEAFDSDEEDSDSSESDEDSEESEESSEEDSEEDSEEEEDKEEEEGAPIRASQQSRKNFASQRNTPFVYFRR
ncbi:uncharacterized protein LOC143019773 [Oratosquilla oratoria]|uniref:uncharacterized protein LOC143019773 n=1 Tax=Oratosquilla oratoria TaxID=337810 RepID=UPI003F75E8EF